MKYIYTTMPFVAAMLYYLTGYAGGTEIEEASLRIAGSILFGAGSIASAIVLSLDELDERRKKP